MSLKRMLLPCVAVICTVLLSSIIAAKDAKEIASTSFRSTVVLSMENADGQEIQMGSGFFIKNGVIATNFHVIQGTYGGNAKLIGSQKWMRVTGILGHNVEWDIALLLVQDSTAPALHLRSSKDIQVGERVYAVGSPEGLEGTFSEGIISGVRELESFKLIQMTAPISHGSSGGPVLDDNGNVIGISTLSFADGQNLNFAIPSEYVSNLVAASTEEQSFLEILPITNRIKSPPSVPSQDLSAIQWTTDNDEPLVGSPDAKRGGVLYDFTTSYPLTFRLHGPNSNDMFANWNQVYAGGSFSLVGRHPTTDNFIPILATHWSVQPDNKTVYYKLDLDARWSDGKPITADDYIFAATFMRNKVIPLPAENQYMEDYIESVEKVAEDVIKIVGKKPSWRPLVDYNFAPLPRHAIKIDAEWPVRENYTPPVVAGPYTITDFKAGERVVFTRIKDWWGDKKRTFTGMFNVDQLVLKVINDPDQSLDYFKKGELSYVTIFRAKTWSTEMEFDAIKKGWAHWKRVFTDTPQGMSGFFLNVKAPIFQNKDFRKALQYLINFDELNSKLMFNAYYRIVSAFKGTEYENHDLKPYGFNPKKAQEHLAKAGYTKRGSDGILVNANGQRASFTLIYGGKGLEPHFNVINNIFKRAGVEMKLQLLEPGASFERGREKAFEAIMISWTAGFYPDPHEYFSCQFADIKQNNNFFGYCNPEVDKLIDIYRFDMDKAKRLEAMHRLDEIIQDEAIYIPFWDAPYVRFVYWDYVRWPENYLPKRGSQLMEYQTFWIDPDRKANLDKAMKEGRSLGEDTVVDVDPYGVKAALDAAAKSPAGQ